MFNYSKPWNDTLDNEVRLGVMAGWPVRRIAENIGKAKRQVDYRIKALKKIEADDRKKKKMLASTGNLINKNGSINYISHLKFGE